MKFTELKAIANKYVSERHSFPCNALNMALNLNILLSNSQHCMECYGLHNTPLRYTPAVLSKLKNEYIIYYNEKSEFYNFYVAHEISHYLLNHTSDCSQNEYDANLLACMLIVPMEKINRNHIFSAIDLSRHCNIPIDVAEIYWQSLKIHTHITHILVCVLCAIIAITGVFAIYENFSQDNVYNHIFRDSVYTMQHKPNIIDRVAFI